MQRKMKGQSLIELMIAFGLTAILLPVLLTAMVASRQGKPQQTQRMQAAGFLKEAAEALRSVREADWSNVAQNGEYHPQVSGSSWALAAGPETVSGFTRKITIGSVFRDATGNIVDSGGTLDASTKKVTMSVSWGLPFLSSLDSIMYLARYTNASFTHTTEVDFNLAGSSKTNVEVTATGGGAVALSPPGSGKGDWCQPKIVGELNLPRQGDARAVTAVPFEAFVGTGLDASGVSLADITISNGSPPVPTVKGTVDGYKTNDVFGEPGYAYLATDNSKKEVVVVDTSTFLEVGFLDIPGNRNARSIYVVGSIGFLVEGGSLVTFDLSSKNGSRPILATLNVGSNASSVFVVGSYAYVAVNSGTNQLTIIEVSPDGRTLTLRGSLTVNGQPGRDVYVSPDGERAYLVTGTSGSQPEFFLINTTSKTAPSLISSYDTNGMDPYGVDMVLSKHRALIVGEGGEEYQVVDVRNESSPIRCGGLNHDRGIFDVDSVTEPDGDAYAYVVTGIANQQDSEFRIIEGGPGGQFASEGVYESATFDAGSEVAFNRFDATFDKPLDSVIRFQVAVADPVGGSCSGVTFDFVGPDGATSSYFFDDGAIPISNDAAGYENPGRCFRYRVYFSPSADFKATPTLYEMVVNYSP